MLLKFSSKQWVKFPIVLINSDVLTVSASVPVLILMLVKFLPFLFVRSLIYYCLSQNFIHWLTQLQSFLKDNWPLFNIRQCLCLNNDYVLILNSRIIMINQYSWIKPMVSRQQLIAFLTYHYIITITSHWVLITSITY